MSTELWICVWVVFTVNFVLAFVYGIAWRKSRRIFERQRELILSMDRELIALEVLGLGIKESKSIDDIEALCRASEVIAKARFGKAKLRLINMDSR